MLYHVVVLFSTLAAGLLEDDKQESSGNGPCQFDCDIDFSSGDAETGNNDDGKNKDSESTTLSSNGFHKDKDDDIKEVGKVDENDEDASPSNGDDHWNIDDVRPVEHRPDNTNQVDDQAGNDKHIVFQSSSTSHGGQQQQLTDSVNMTTTPSKLHPIESVSPSSTTRQLTSLRIPSPSQSIDSSVKLGSSDSSFIRNLALIGGVGAGIVLLLLLIIYAIYKYRSRDEGTYKIDESKQYTYSTCNMRPPSPPGDRTNCSRSQNGQSQQRQKRRDIKEWYV